jgi:catechol 2,3-dioxygenase-like lactoylglutathione lyase family enzyme
MEFRVTLPATDMDRARAWYASVLGLEPVRVDDNGDAWYESGSTHFLLYGSRFAGTNEATAATIEVEDVEATVAELKARGATLEEYDFGEDFRTVDGLLTLPDGEKVGWVKDSEGNILSISPSRR